MLLRAKGKVSDGAVEELFTISCFVIFNLIIPASMALRRDEQKENVEEDDNTAHVDKQTGTNRTNNEAWIFGLLTSRIIYKLLNIVRVFSITIMFDLDLGIY